MTPEPSWKSLSDAAKYLGVHFSTLRRWADQGLIEFVRTPGGKRKFQQKALDDFVEKYRSLPRDTFALVRLQDEAIRKTRENLQAQDFSRQGWYLRLTEDQRASLRGSGSRLIALMLHYCSSTRAENLYLDEAKRITREYGEICSLAGMPIRECINTFLLFRRPMINAVYETSSLHGQHTEENHQLFEKMTVFLDEIMVTMIDEFHLRQPTNPSHI